ncbi:hypothetical protein QCA50_005423 [Cerrena zonata]|uniref:Uncharacterized protein n=1 Tax=Cerrena zonata TaxID=2478898 RepID=A0AAW0GEY4_9APHY
MQALRTVVRSFLQKRASVDTSLLRQGIDPSALRGLKPFYERKLPIWSRYTYTLVCINVLVTVSAAELTLRHWTKLEDLPEPSPNSPSGSTEPQEERKWVLRPLYHRLPLALVHLGIGYGIINLVLTSRARTVRRMWVIPPPETTPVSNPGLQATRHNLNNIKPTSPSLTQTQPHNPTQYSPKSQLIIQTAKHVPTQGRVSQIRACSLISGSAKDASDSLRLKIPGFQGMFTIGLNDVLIEGEKKDKREASEALYKLFGKRVKWVFNDAQ